MQACSTIILQYPSKREEAVTKSIVFLGTRKCEITDLTFEELIPKRKGKNLPCMILRVKDSAGKMHLFDGCSAEVLQIIKKPGSFRLNNHDHLSHTVQWFELVSSAQQCHSFSLVTTMNYALQHGNEAWSKKRGHARDVVMAKKWFEAVLKDDPNNTRALLVLGQIYEEGARACFEKVAIQDPNNSYAKEMLEKMEEKEAAVVAKKLEDLTIAPAPQEVLPPKPKRNECGCALM